jgi:hypothetical protein
MNVHFHLKKITHILKAFKMKKFNALLVASLFFLFLAFSQSSTAQCIDGGNQQFQGVFKSTLKLNATCSMIIEYCFRTYKYQTGGRIDYDCYISKISFSGDCDRYRIMFDENPTSFIQRAWENLVIMTNPWKANIPICPTQSNEYWRYGHASCYSSEWIAVWVPDDSPELGHFEWVKAPCNNIAPELCWVTMKVCKQYNPKTHSFELTKTVTEKKGGNPNCGTGCTYICE